MVLTKLLDNRTVVLSSNFTSIGESDLVKRWDKSDKTFLNVSCPEVAKGYNIAIGGVDVFNSYISLYKKNINSKKWTLRLIFHNIDMTVCNSWLQYKIVCKQ